VLVGEWDKMTRDNKVILLVDDNPDDQFLTLRALHKHHPMNEVVVVSGAGEALEYLHANGRHAGGDSSVLPALILLDLNMIGPGGLDLIQRIRSDVRTRLIPIVILTSSIEDQDIIAGYTLGANAYVRKPVDFGEFSEAIRRLGQFWLLLNEIPRGVSPRL
jgi:CheY-like chemotaxis protein